MPPAIFLGSRACGSAHELAEPFTIVGFTEDTSSEPGAPDAYAFFARRGRSPAGVASCLLQAQDDLVIAIYSGGLERSDREK